MSESTRPSMRIDWFDGSVTEEVRPSQPQFDETELTETNKTETKPQYTERKLMGFKRLQDLSQEETSRLILQLSGRTSFWDLLQTELKGDFIVLIAKIIAKLYLYLQSGGISTVLINLLRNKFVTSKFFVTVYDYLISLPQTRIVDKRMNMLFWEDLESLYLNILKICEGVCVFDPKNVNKVSNLVEATVISVNGVISEHKEQFTNHLSEKIDLVSKMIHELTNNIPKTDSEDTLTEYTKEDFYKLNIFPTHRDLFSPPCHIEANIVNGAFTSVQHYLDVQFKLLREDYFGPLREGLMKYIENPTKRQHEKIWVHLNVKVIRPYVSTKEVGHLVNLAMGSVYKEKYSQKQFMYGSLLLFSANNFNTILCATVLDCNPNLLKEGYIAVSFQSDISCNLFTEIFTMVESEVFFEPYHRVLKVLQECSGKDIPMKKYIVDVKPEIEPPEYLSEETTYSLYTPLLDTEITFPVLKTDKWPKNSHFQLDSSQMDAFKFALTKEFSTIQGPPGTGKTFIGVKIAETILKNISLNGTPMLILSYTNHALDQFLEAILETTKNLIRLGSQSKNDKIEPYTLNNLRIKNKSKHAYLYANKRFEKEKLFNDIMLIQENLRKCEKEILCYNTIKSFLKIGSKKYELNVSMNEDPVIKWLFDNEQVVREENQVFDDWEKEFDEKVGFDEKVNFDEKGNFDEKVDFDKKVNFDEKVDFDENKGVQSCFSYDLANKEIEGLEHSLNNIYRLEGQKDAAEIFEMRRKIRNRIDKIKARLTILEDRVIKTTIDYRLFDRNLKAVQNLYILNLEERWIVYFQAVNSVRNNLLTKLDTLKKKYTDCLKELEEISSLIDGELVKTARLVGATTSVAARLHTLLQEIKSPIVIVEEAAEIFEAHIVASLTKYCKHLILIGDHKQLRPTAAHYKMAIDNNLEISLFERMINNGINCKALTTQRRMRPAFVELLVPTFYTNLENNENVTKYPNIRGMDKNLLFLTHGHFENENVEYSFSYKNDTEAEWCVTLANYLIQYYYSAHELTILTTYNAQALLIKELSKKYESLQNCRITVVDNFQGEESRIVILSLVRSNRDSSIGFLAHSNRICVALSRAREGLYIFGNMEVLKCASPIWRTIDKQLKSQDAISDVITLSCSKHANTMVIKSPGDFKKVKGGCFVNCDLEKN